MDFIFVTVFAGDYIVYNRGAIGAKSALAVFTHAHGRLVRVIEAVHDLSISHSEQ